jgi:hypothetical protein
MLLWRSTVSHFSGEAEGSSLPEGQPPPPPRPISFVISRSPPKLSRELARIAGHNVSPDAGGGKRPGGVGKK